MREVRASAALGDRSQRLMSESIFNHNGKAMFGWWGPQSRVRTSRAGREAAREAAGQQAGLGSSSEGQERQCCNEISKSKSGKVPKCHLFGWLG